jgi:hypothetical protein
MYHARIGPTEFAFCHADLMAIPTVEGPVVGFIDEVPIHSVAVGHEWYLAIDHRPSADSDRAAYIEWWHPVSCVEMPLTWLLVVTAASSQTRRPLEPCRRCSADVATDSPAPSARTPKLYRAWRT